MTRTFIDEPPPTVPDLVFLDLDGTLLNSQLSLSDRNRDTIIRCQRAGVHVVIASGRPFASILRFASLLDGDQYVVASNGGAVLHAASRTVLSAAHMTAADVGGVLAIAEAAGASACVYEPATWFVERVDKWIEIEIGRTGTRPSIKPLGSLSGPLIKVLLIGETDSLRKCEDLLASSSEVAHWFYTYPEYLEVMPRGVSKKHACETIMSHLGVETEDVLAIGDGYNDLPMLECAKYRMAVANASSQLLAGANCLTLSNDDDGVAVALEGVVLKDSDALGRLTWI